MDKIDGDTVAGCETVFWVAGRLPLDSVFVELRVDTGELDSVEGVDIKQNNPPSRWAPLMSDQKSETQSFTSAKVHWASLCAELSWLFREGL